MNMGSTWGEKADGHEQHMFLLMQVELFQTNLKLHQWLQQLQSVTRCRRRPRHTINVVESTLTQGN